MPGYTRVADFQDEGATPIFFLDADWPDCEMKTILAVYESDGGYAFIEDRWDGDAIEEFFEDLGDAELAFDGRAEELRVQRRKEITAL